MPSLNTCHFIGNLTRDPELRVTPKGTSIAQFGIAINRKFKDADGQAREEVTFIDVEAWGRTADTIAKYCQKGQALYVQAHMKLDQWTDKESGQKRSKLKAVVDSFQFLGGREGGSEGSQADAPDDTDQTRRKSRASSSRRDYTDDIETDHIANRNSEIADDDVPF